MADNPASGHRKRLKERFLRASLEGFHDYEALELFLTFAIPRRDVKPLAKELIKRFKGLKGVFEASCEEISSVPGMGENSAVFISLLKELASAYVDEEAVASSPIKSPADAVDFVSNRFDCGRERFLALYLNSKNEVLGIEPFHEGDLKGIAVSPREVIEKAFGHNARSIIFVHTKAGAPSIPQKDEKRLVEELEEAALAIDVLVHDHIITGKGRHLSAREMGWLKPPNPAL